MSEIQTRSQTPQIVRYAGQPARSAGGAPAAGGITGRDVWRIMRKRKWLIILPTILFTVLSAVLTLLWLRYAPFWTATAYVAVNPPTSGPLGAQRVFPYSTDIVERLVMSQAQMVTSEAVLRIAINDEGVKKTEWFREDPGSAVTRLDEITRVAPVPNTNLIDISVTLTSQKEAPDIATAIAVAFVRDTVQAALGANQKTISFLDGARTEKQRVLGQVRQQKTVIQAGTETPDLQARGGVATMKLRALQAELLKLDIEKAEAEESLTALRTQGESGELAKSHDVLGRLSLDPRLRMLRQNELTLSVQLDNALRKYGPDHRQVLNIQTNLDSMRKKTKEREDDLTTLYVSAMLDGASSTLGSITAKQLSLREGFNKTAATVKDIERTLAQLAVLDSQEEAMDREIQRIDSRLTELRLESRDQQPVRLRRAAETPEEPSLPKWEIMIPAGVMLGLIVGLGLAFLLEFMDTSIKSAADIRRRMDVAILGMVPHTEDLEEEVEDIRTAFMGGGTSLINEAFRQIRTCMLFSAPVEHRRCVLVTSPLPEDGRTSITMNLAASIARGGRKVMVIDTNFRQPVTSRLFAGDRKDGLCNVLVGQCEWRDVVTEVEANLHVLASGPLPPNPAELLGSEKMREVLAEISNQYDQVLLDGAPCLVVTDSPILSTIVDGVVLVVRAGANTHGILQRTRDMLGRIGARVLGVVLNGVRVTTGGYLRKNYDTFYEYQDQGQLPAESPVEES